MTVLPETPAATAAGQTDRNTVIEQQADQLLAALNAITPTQHPDARPKASIGTAPPVPQPGIPPMSSKAVDDTVRILAVGAASLPIGGMTALVLHVLGTVDPTQLAIGAAAPTALALALARLLGRAKAVLPAEHHHHYTGPVHQDQRNVENKNTGVWVKNTNQQ